MVSKLRGTYGITLITFSLGLLVLLVSCPDSGVGPENGDGLSGKGGTITAHLTGAGDHEGRGFMFEVFNEGVTDIFTAISLGGSDLVTIVGGTVESVALGEATNAPVTFTAGMSYAIGGLIDANGDDIPSDGDYVTDPPITVVVDGDMIVELVYPTDFIVATGVPQAGTITVGVTGAGDYNGRPFFCSVVAVGDNLNDKDNWLGTGNEPTITGGTAETLMYDVDTISTPIVFMGGDSYDVGGLIDVDGNDDYTSQVDYLTFPVLTVAVDGNTIVEFVYPTDFILAP